MNETSPRFRRPLLRMLMIVLLSCAGLLLLVGCMQRRLLYFPTHAVLDSEATRAGLTRWEIDGKYVGWARLVTSPRRVWLVLHGNGGQAGHRGYMLPHVHENDAVFILEYPGYGGREGKPSRSQFDAAAEEGYRWLIRAYGAERMGVIGESLGSGPACQLARTSPAPAVIALVVPFDVLSEVAQEKLPMVGFLLLDRWDNLEALRGYRGKLHIFGAENDSVIPVHHARRLAEQTPGAVFHLIPGGHDWSQSRAVDLSEL